MYILLLNSLYVATVRIRHKDVAMTLMETIHLNKLDHITITLMMMTCIYNISHQIISHKKCVVLILMKQHLVISII